MDQADMELRETITNIWPLQAKKMLNLLVPPIDQLNKGKLSVGKIYAGFLILESWRNTRFGQIDSGMPVSLQISYSILKTKKRKYISLHYSYFDGEVENNSKPCASYYDKSHR